MGFSFQEPEEFSREIASIPFSDLKPTLRVCVIEKCNLNCEYCHKEGMNSSYAERLEPKEFRFIAKIFRNKGLKKVKFTGGEPLLRKDLSTIIKAFKENDFEDISLITNGTLLNRQNLQEMKNAGLDRITISFDTLKKKTAKKLNGCDCLEKVLENVALARAYFEDVKVNCVTIPAVNFPDELLEIANFCRDNKVTLKLLSKLSEESPYPLSNQALSIIKLYKQLTKKETNNEIFVPSTTYTFSDGTKIEINDFRNEEYRKRIRSHTECGKCPFEENCIEGPYAIRVMPNGDVKPCLVREDNIIKFRKLVKSPTKLICLTGLASSGKSSFTKVAEERFRIKNVYVGKILKEETTRRKKPITYENIMKVSREIYEKEGQLGAIIKSFQAIQNSQPNEKIILLDSVRSVAEYDFLKQFFKTYLVGVICNKKERFKRAKKGDFKLTKEQLVKRDELEMGKLKESPFFNVGELLGHADYYISGESKNFEEDAKQIIRGIIND